MSRGGRHQIARAPPQNPSGVVKVRRGRTSPRPRLQPGVIVAQLVLGPFRAHCRFIFLPARLPTWGFIPMALPDFLSQG